MLPERGAASDRKKRKAPSSAAGAPAAKSKLVKAETRSFHELAVARAVRRVVASLDEALDLKALAREAGLAPFQFHRIFRGMVGETPLEPHRPLRLERAAH